MTAGDAKVSLAADADAASHGGSAQPNVMNHLQADTDSTDGPLVVGESAVPLCAFLCLLWSRQRVVDYADYHLEQSVPLLDLQLCFMSLCDNCSGIRAASAAVCT